MSQIDTLLAALIKVEGGYVNNPADRGGPTNYGITQAVARAHGYAGMMQSLPLGTALAIYKADYWTLPHFDLVEAAAPKVAAEMFDTAVNAGIGTAVMFLQRALNVLYGSNLKLDGALSPAGATLTTLSAYLASRPRDGAATLLKLMNCFQGERYAEIVEKNPSQRTFINGWIANRVELAA
jgi:lysozyme family protein